MKHLTAYGDSIVAGYGAPLGHGFVPQLATLLAQKRKSVALPFFNLGQSGMTTFALQSALIYNEAFAESLVDAASICLLIGGDDLIDDLPILLSQNEKEIELALTSSKFEYMKTLIEMKKRTTTPIAVGTIYNPYPATDLAETVVRLYNDLVVIPSAHAVGALIAPIYSAFSGKQPILIEGYSGGIAGKPGRQGVTFPIHPNARGHQVIAEVFASVLP
ncbi:SGNH/GDSL hydrolase family protein [Sulfoacidibacillus thermotolerans]|uniref:SGNH hydrolase-type esterase domain-containing protein n=1 Tax=Sulfoacidibacillus thermotolerans TaxID=1765684 RepID=A0A2U3D9I1_SULT2|nr:SGNH/GDSL hydrolase family protein [Sulfoacidibacillus thermotolerans]PWI57934.1 hypothetical protein BM613_05850 [Sulfoacidibacillus thermotolerans]